MIPLLAHSTPSLARLLIDFFLLALLFAGAFALEKWSKVSAAKAEKSWSDPDSVLRKMVVFETAAAEDESGGHNWCREITFYLSILALGILIVSSFWGRLFRLGEVFFCLATLAASVSGAWTPLAILRRLQSLPVPSSYLRKRQIETLVYVFMIAAVACFLLTWAILDFRHRRGSFFDATSFHRKAASDNSP